MLVYIAVSLSALSMGATPFQVGILHGFFALFPLVLAVYAGKISDRIGVKRPIVAGSVMMSAGILVPFAIPGLAGLMVCATLVGLGQGIVSVAIWAVIVLLPLALVLAFVLGFAWLAVRRRRARPAPPAAPAAPLDLPAA